MADLRGKGIADGEASWGGEVKGSTWLGSSQPSSRGERQIVKDSGGGRPGGPTTMLFLFENLLHRIQKQKKIAHPWLPADVMSLDQKSSDTHIITQAQTQHAGHKNFASVQGANIDHQTAESGPWGYRDKLAT